MKYTSPTAIQIQKLQDQLAAKDAVLAEMAEALDTAHDAIQYLAEAEHCQLTIKELEAFIKVGKHLKKALSAAKVGGKILWQGPAHLHNDGREAYLEGEVESELYLPPDIGPHGLKVEVTIRAVEENPNELHTVVETAEAEG